MSLCDGPCSVNGDNIVDLVQYQGTAAGPALPSKVSFAPSPVVGVDSNKLDNNTVYRRLTHVGKAPALLASDWAWRCSTFKTCLVADSFEANTNGSQAWILAGGANYSATGTDSVSVSGTSSVYHQAVILMRRQVVEQELERDHVGLQCRQQFVVHVVKLPHGGRLHPRLGAVVEHHGHDDRQAQRVGVGRDSERPNTL